MEFWVGLSHAFAACHGDSALGTQCGHCARHGDAMVSASVHGAACHYAPVNTHHISLNVHPDTEFAKLTLENERAIAFLVREA